MAITGSSGSVSQAKKARFRLKHPKSMIQRPSEPRGWICLGWRSIYVLPTATGCAFLLSLAVMLLLAINYQNSLAYALCFLLGSVFMLSLIPAWRALYGLKMQAVDSPAVFVGQRALYRLHLEPYVSKAGVCLGDSVDTLKPPSPLGDTQASFQQLQPSVRRGWCSGGVIRVESRVPFGLWVAWSWVDPEWTVLVYPKPIPTQSLNAQTNEDQGDPQPHAGLGDYNGVRRWQPGESMRRLDWKAFSREQGLLAKDFIALSSFCDVLDFEALSGDTELRLSYLCHELLLRAKTTQPFSLRLPGKHLGPDYGMSYLHECLQALALYRGKE